MSRVAIVLLSKETYYFPYINRDNLDIIGLCGKSEQTWLRLCKYFPFYVENTVKKKLAKKRYDSIIIFDVVLRFLPNLMDKLKDINCTKILYIWNMIGNDKYNLSKKFSYFNSIYSFSKFDCEKYKLNYLPLMAKNIMDGNLQKLEMKYDFFFLGYIKNRKDLILKIANKLSGFNLKCFVVSNEKIDSPFIECLNTKMEYVEYIKYLQQSNCIIDINDEGQDGYTLRMAEAFCYNKKIITTNSNVLQSEFFDDTRILFYRDGLTHNDIAKFLSQPIKHTNEKYFDFDTWLSKITS